MSRKTLFALLIVFMFICSVQSVNAVLWSGSHVTSSGDAKFVWHTHKFSNNHIRMDFKLHYHSCKIPGYMDFKKISKTKLKVTYWVRGHSPGYYTIKYSGNAKSAYAKMKPYLIYRDL